MEEKCPRCGTVPETQDKFCGACGFNLAAVPGIPAGTQVEMKLSDIHFNLGVVYFKNGKYQQSIEMFEKVLRDDPQHQEALEMLDQVQNAISEKVSS